MRILHVDTGKTMRGGQWQVLLLLKGLKQEGFEQTLLAPAASPLARHAAALSIEVQPLGWWKLHSLVSQFALVHAHDARAHTMACMQRSKPLVVARRVAFPIRRSLLSAWKYRQAKKFIAVSQFVASQLRAAGVAEEKIAVVYDGVTEAEPARGRGWIVAPATEDPAKGSALLRATGCDVRFSQNLPQDLQQASLMAYITHAEGLGSAALLAMAASVPVVASKVGGLMEVVEDGVTGLLVENEPTRIRAAIERVLHDPRLAEEMGRRGRQRCLRLFSAEQMVLSTMKIYQEVLK